LRTTVDEAYLTFENFFEQFHTDAFAYHASTIAEFLNNIRWEIYEYLLEEYRRSHSEYQQDAYDKSPEANVAYKYDIPSAISNGTASTMYWELMNRCRSRPWCQLFTVDKHLKGRY